MARWQSNRPEGLGGMEITERAVAQNGFMSSAQHHARCFVRLLCPEIMNAVRAKLKQAILYIERNPKLVRSLTCFPYIVNSL
jgi:hypothetical protein